MIELNYTNHTNMSFSGISGSTVLSNNVLPLFFIIVLILLSVVIFLFKDKIMYYINNLHSTKKDSTEPDETKKPKQNLPISSDKEAIEQKAQMFKELAMKEQERAKKLEEKYDELRVEYEKLKEYINNIKNEIKNKDELVKKVEEENKKFSVFINKRYKKGHYIPVVMWTKRGNAMIYKFVVEIGWVNGGWRALLVDTLSSDPETGEWFPSLDKPAPNFVFRDDPGFEPDNPEHTVLFDVSKHDFEEDLMITSNDPNSKPVAFVFGIDEEGNPVHKLQFGSGLHINTLRSENRKLKIHSMMLMHRLRETEAKLSDLEYQLQMERDLRIHAEKEIKLLKSQLYEHKDVINLLDDELDAVREAWRTQKLRRESAIKRAEEAEKLFNAYYGRPQIIETPLTPYLEQKSKEKDAKLVALLAPIARREASMYDIDKTGKSDEEIVDEWIKKKIETEGIKGWINTAKELGIDMTISDIIKEGIS